MARKVIETPSGPVVIYTPDEEVSTPNIAENLTTGSNVQKTINPQGYFTTDPSIGGGSGAMSNLLDPMDPAGAYKAFLAGRLYPSEVGDYSNLTSTSPLTSGGPFNLLPTPEGALTLGVGAINPLFGLLTRGAISGRNAEALETLVKSGILTAEKPAEPSSGFRKFLGYEYTPGTGQYRLSPETGLDLMTYVKETGKTPKDYFESQFQSQYGDANDLARYLDQIAYTTQGQFFTKDFFGNPTPWSKYVDRQGNIRPDALDNWKKFGAEDKMGVLNMFKKKDQGTQAGTTDQETSGGGGYIGAPMESQQTGGGGISDLPTKSPFSSPNRRGVTSKTPFEQTQRIAKNVERFGKSYDKSKGYFTKGR